MPRITDEERERFHKYLDAAIDKLNSQKNCEKPHWSTQSNDELFDHLNRETEELDYELYYYSPANVVDDCNDVINIAMMIIDNNNNASPDK